MHLGALLLLSLAADAGAGESLVFGPPMEVLTFRLDCPAGTRQDTSMDYEAHVALHACRQKGKTAGPVFLQDFEGKPVASREDAKTCRVMQPEVLARSKFRGDFTGCAAK